MQGVMLWSHPLEAAESNNEKKNGKSDGTRTGKVFNIIPAYLSCVPNEAILNTRPNLSLYKVRLILKIH